MSENRPGPDEAQGKSAEDSAQSPSRRRVLKAAAAAAPIIMSIKARPAFANNDDKGDKDKKKESHSMSHNMSQKPSKKK
jgi:hypothetical protein